VIRKLIEDRKVMGWDDPRLVTIKALRRRGFIPEMFKELAQTVGMSKSGGHIDPTVLAAANRSLIDGQVNRYFLVIDPVKIRIEGAPAREVKIDLHPKFTERGKRILKVKGEVYLEKADLAHLSEGKLHRLMDYCNFKIEKGKYLFISESYEDFKNSGQKGQIIHWLPAQENIKCSVLMDDGHLATGLGEITLQNLQVGDLVQLEREFYARVDQKTKDGINFWYLHK
jgi:glutamyl-tRNA synthetase